MARASMKSLLAVFAAIACSVMLSAAPALAQPDLSAAPLTGVSVKPLPKIAAAKPAADTQAQHAFDPEKATSAYLTRISGKARARSDAYFEGGYWLQLADLIYALVVAAILLWLTISQRMRAIAQKITQSRFWQAPIYAIEYVVVTMVLTLPLSIYEGFIREHAYGLSNQNFGQWFADFGTGFLVQLIGLTIFITVLYAVIRRAPRSWWAWGTLVAFIFMIIGSVVAPIWIEPLFNHYTTMPPGPVRDSILSMAQGDGVPARNVYVFDASRQSDRISANVSGLFGTTQISITDNLLKRGTPAETKAVLGHEIGHFVLGHVYTGLMWFTIVFLFGFLFADWLARLAIRHMGPRWGVTGLDDPAGLPALAAAAVIFFFLVTPVTNTITRTQEAQADMFGLNTAREPDAFATVTLKLSEYRKLDPSPLEEFVFYDHPSGRNRVWTAMNWKAHHLNDPDIRNGPVSPQ